MEIYTVSQPKLEHIQSRLIRVLSISLLILIAIALIIAVSYNPEQALRNRKQVLYALLFIIIAGGFVIYYLQKQIMRGWSSLCIEIGEDYITGEKERTSLVKIQSHEITSIEEMFMGLHIRTTNKYRSLLIPNELDQTSYEAIKLKLATWQEIKHPSRTANIKLIGQTLGPFILFFIILFAESFWLVVTASLVFFIDQIHGYWLQRWTEGNDPKSARSSLLGIWLIALILLIWKLYVYPIR